MMRFIRRATGNRALTGIVGIASGSALAGVLGLIASPILARIYSPDEMGVYSVVFAIASVISVTLLLGYPRLIVVATNEVTAAALVRISLVLGAVSTVVLTFVCWVFGEAIDGLSDADLRPWVYLVPSIALVLAVSALTVQVASRERQYTLIAFRSATQALFVQGGQILLGLGKSTAGSLLVGEVTGRLLVTASFLPSIRKLLRHRSYGSFLTTARNYRRFAVLVTWAALLNTLSVQLPLLLLGWLYGPVQAGYFGLTFKFIWAPIALLGVAVAQVFFSEIGRRVRVGIVDNRDLYLRVSLRLGVLVPPTVLGLVFVPPWVVPWLFGEQWVGAIPLMQASAPAVGSALVGATLAPLFNAYERSFEMLMQDLARFTLILVSGLVAYRMGCSAAGAVLTMSTAQASVYLWVWLRGLHVASGSGQAHTES